MRTVKYPIIFTEKQKKLITSDVYEILIDGNKGGGKTECVIGKIYHDGRKYKNMSMAFFRRTLPEARETIIKYAYKSYPNGTYHHKVAQNRIVFPSTKSNCLLGHIENDKDLLKYQGFSFQKVFFDEATSFTPKQIGYIKAQVRSTNPNIKPQIIYSTNPGGISHGWFKQRFIDGKEPWVKYETPESIKRRKREGWGIERAVYLMRCNVMLEDNPTLMINDPDYMTRLDELSEDDKPALRFGSWDILAGRFFKIKPETHKIPPYKPKHDDYLFISCDWGTDKPYSVGWYAVTPNDHIIRYRELYGISDKGIDNDGSNIDAGEVATMIIENTPIEENIKYMVLDTACWAQQGHGISIKDILQDKLKTRGIFITKATKDRVNGWQAIKKYLHIDLETNTPFFQATTDCVHFWRTIPYLIYDGKKQGDMNTDGEDHCVTGDTLIHTQKGLRRIDTIKVGDMVLTRNGYDVVTKVWRNGVKPVLKINTTDTSLKITGNHKIYANNEWKRVDELRYFDIIETWQQNQLYSKESSIVNMDYTIVRLRDIKRNIISKDYTKISGKTKMDKYQKDTWFTIKISILKITILQILNYLRIAFTASCMLTEIWKTKNIDKKIKKHGEKLKKLQKSGIEANLAENGTLNMEKKHGKTESIKKKSAYSVEGHIKQEQVEYQNTATKTVRLHPFGEEEVFNLSLARYPEYYANGLLVHNCADEWRYFIMSRPLPKKIRESAEAPAGSMAWFKQQSEAVKSKYK